MKTTTIIALSIICCMLLIHTLFLAQSTDGDTKEIKYLKKRVDSLEFSIYIDSLQDKIYKDTRKTLGIE